MTMWPITSIMANLMIRKIIWTKATFFDPNFLCCCKIFVEFQINFCTYCVCFWFRLFDLVPLWILCFKFNLHI
jgi:hypothetical protein